MGGEYLLLHSSRARLTVVPTEGGLGVQSTAMNRGLKCPQWQEPLCDALLEFNPVRLRYNQSDPFPGEVLSDQLVSWCGIEPFELAALIGHRAYRATGRAVPD